MALFDVFKPQHFTRHYKDPVPDGIGAVSKEVKKRVEFENPLQEVRSYLRKLIEESRLLTGWEVDYAGDRWVEEAFESLEVVENLLDKHDGSPTDTGLIRAKLDRLHSLLERLEAHCLALEASHEKQNHDSAANADRGE